MPLAEALSDLRERGLKIVFTSGVVRPGMTVEAEPTTGDPRGILDQILAPHGLTVRDGPRGTLVVVRRPGALPGGRAKEDAPGTPRAAVPVMQESVRVTPSRVSLMRETRAAGIGFGSDEIQALPHLGDDFFRAVTLAPGIAGNDVSAQFHVRGGRRDETQVLLDGQELYEAYHLKDIDSALSFVSSSTLKRAELSTGGFSAEYGDRMAGVLDMRTRTPSGPTIFRAGASVLSLHAGGAGGFDGDRGSWLVEARRGTADLVNELLDTENPRYADAYVKLGYRLDDRNRLRFHLLTSDDRYLFNEVLEDESNRIDTNYRSSHFWLTHELILTPRVLVETTVSRTGLDQDRAGFENDERVQFELRDRRATEVLGVRQGWTVLAGERHQVKLGAELRAFDTEYDYRSNFVFDDPLAEIRDDPEGGETRFDGRFRADHSTLYISDRITLAESLTLELGLRRDHYSLTDERHTSPRINLAWSPFRSGVLRAAWGRYHQSQRSYELQVEDGDRTFYPTERSDHRVLGYEHLFAQDRESGGVTLRIEVYQRKVRNPRPRFENLYEARNTFPELEPDRVRIEPDRGVAKGVELFVQGSAGKRLRWFANYAWASTEDRIDGRDVPREFDQRHALNLDVDYRIGEHWRLNAAWRYHTGWPTTPLSLEEIDNEGETVWIPVLGPLNSDRLSDYHRLDVRASREFRVGRASATFFVDVQNVYDRKNLAGFDIEIDEEEGLIDSEREYWAGILPSAGIRFSF